MIETPFDIWELRVFVTISVAPIQHERIFLELKKMNLVSADEPIPWHGEQLSD